MSAGVAAEVVLTVVALFLFAFLALDRYRSLNRPRFAMAPPSRLLLVDMLLVVAGIEMVADSLSHAAQPIGEVAGVVAVTTRGALVAGAIVLVATFQRQMR